MSAVTYVDGMKTFRTYRFNTLANQGCVSELLECLNYAHKKLNTLVTQMKETIKGYN